MNAESIENELIEAAIILGGIVESNSHYTCYLAIQIEKSGKQLNELTMGELIALHTDCKKTFNNSSDKKPDALTLEDANLPPISLDDLLNKQAQQPSIEYLPLEPELLIKRVKDGGHSGNFLAHAFISSYRTCTPFDHSLGEIIKLDHEAIQLFHAILHIRFIKGWSDDALYKLEKKIIALNEVKK